MLHIFKTDFSTADIRKSIVSLEGLSVTNTDSVQNTIIKVYFAESPQPPPRKKKRRKKILHYTLFLFTLSYVLFHNSTPNVKIESNSSSQNVSVQFLLFKLTPFRVFVRTSGVFLHTNVHVACIHASEHERVRACVCL